jgi:hypothetical protein
LSGQEGLREEKERDIDAVSNRRREEEKERGEGARERESACGGKERQQSLFLVSLLFTHHIIILCFSLPKASTWKEINGNAR